VIMTACFRAEFIIFDEFEISRSLPRLFCDAAFGQTSRDFFYFWYVCWIDSLKFGVHGILNAITLILNKPMAIKFANYCIKAALGDCYKMFDPFDGI